MNLPSDLPTFLLKAKKVAYAGEGRQTTPSRRASIDLPFEEGDYSYLDTYLGGYAFIGEEAVWHYGKPIWGMNYYGTMLVPEIPTQFGYFLKQALLRVPIEAPFRGPALFVEVGFTYRCTWRGDLTCYVGEESIEMDGTVIYKLNFHGGMIR